MDLQLANAADVHPPDHFAWTILQPGSKFYSIVFDHGRTSFESQKRQGVCDLIEMVTQ